MKKEIVEKLLGLKDTTKVKVRMNDTDMLGMTHFKNYLVFFDDGFVSYMNKILAPKRIEETVHEGYAFPVKHVDITYEGSAKFGDYVIIETTVEKIGNSSLLFNHDLFKEVDHSLLAKVKSTRIAMELSTRKLINVADFFEKYVV